MPSRTFHMKELDSDKITLDGTLSVSGASTLRGNAVLSSNLTVAGMPRSRTPPPATLGATPTMVRTVGVKQNHARSTIWELSLI